MAKMKKIIANTPIKTNSIGEIPVTIFTTGMAEINIKDNIVEMDIPINATIYSKIAILLFLDNNHSPIIPEKLENKTKIIKR